MDKSGMIPDGPENSPVLLRGPTAPTHKLQNVESSRSPPGPKGLKLQVPARLSHQILLRKETRLWTVLVLVTRVRRILL